MEVVTLQQDCSADTDVEIMTCDIVEVVVDGVHGDSITGASADLGGSTRAVMNVVVCESNVVCGTIEEHCPIVLAVASGGPGSLTIEFIVGDCESASCVVSSDKHLSTDE